MLTIHGATLSVIKRTSDWIVVLAGNAQQIQDAHYSLYNWNATSIKEPDTIDDTRVSIVSDFDRMHQYFYNRLFAEKMDSTDRERYRGKRAWRHFIAKHAADCAEYADKQMATLLADAEHTARQGLNDSFSLGSIIAEKPDDDAKTAWWRVAGAM